tara:strand:- start:211 stop:510 length:300 start_codon:yes stop_codon:yes gene_type:complete
LLSTYERIKCADERCKEIGQELSRLPAMEYCEEGQRLQTRGLNQEYIWSATFIINQCQHILDSQLDDAYGEEVDFRIKLSYFQEYYEQVIESLNNSKSE